ncbi:MAG: ABC transporter ATP-binding protein, partial [Clostridiales bacterium]
MEKLLDVQDLRTHFFTRDGEVPAVDGVSFHINKGETVGLVGESGSGKSITALSVLRLVPCPPGKILTGDIHFDGEDVRAKSDKEMRGIRGNHISMIFQEPMTSLNPVYTIGFQICEVLKLHAGMNKKQATEKAMDLLSSVGIASPAKRLQEYPYQLSGGMRQRAMIAMAFSCAPKLLIADEPTTALDVTIQAQILDLMQDLKEKNNMSLLMITHDLGVIAEVCQRVIVMYAGKIVEQAKVADLFDSPMHPYTQGLLISIPRIDTPKGKLAVIKGSVPRPTNFPTGCRFHPRCEHCMDICSKQMPPIVKIGEDREVACWLHANG